MRNGLRCSRRPRLRYPASWSFWDPATGTFHLPTLRSVAENLRVELQVHEVVGGDVLNRAFDAARAWGANGLNVLASPLLHALRQPIIDQAAADQLPAIYQWGESARAGGLMSYGPFRNDVYQPFPANSHAY